MLTAFISIIVITVLAALVRQFLRITICPICVGVASTWIWLLVASLIGYAVDPMVIGILMGGSVVGIAYQTSWLLPITRSELLWKSLFIPVGFVLVFSVLTHTWSIVSGLIILVVLLAFWFFMPWITTNKQPRKGQVESLEEKMKKCC